MYGQKVVSRKVSREVTKVGHQGCHRCWTVDKIGGGVVMELTDRVGWGVVLYRINFVNIEF